MRWLILAVAVAWTAPARAVDPAPMVVAGPLDGAPLGRHAWVLDDASGRLTLADVLGASAARFRPVATDVPHYGMSPHAYWFRVAVQNDGDRLRGWFLEVDNAQLDYVTLYVPGAGGEYRELRTGDALPFNERSLAYATFLFELQTAGHATDTLYLRVQTEGVAVVPLRAYDERALWGHQLASSALAWVFYGALCAMALQALIVFAMTGRHENLAYAAYLLSCLVCTATLLGHTLEFVFPHAPRLAQRVLLPSMAAAYLFAAAFVSAQAEGVVQRASPRGTLRALAGVFVATLVLPFAPGALVLLVSGAFVHLWAIKVALRVMQTPGDEARPFVLSFSFPVLGAALFGLHALGLVPSTFVTRWSVQLGLTAQMVLISSGLADKLTRARARVESLSSALASHVQALSHALDEARVASQRAERATAERDAFMATIHHEFRTPLNPVINLPPGLSQEFEPVPHAVCAACASEFLLDEGEAVTANTACPACHELGGLSVDERLAFVGDAARARHLLARIEHSGRSLLWVVDGVLEFSRLEAGHATLALRPVALVSLVNEVLAQLEPLLGEPAPEIRVDVPSALWVTADPERLAHVLAQLVHNAYKFSDAPAEIVVRATSAEGMCTLCVEDRGVGIPEDARARVFQSFQQASMGDTRRHGGTGLGLSICKTLVEAHGGRVWIDARPGRGTRVAFTIPLAEPACAQQGAARCG